MNITVIGYGDEQTASTRFRYHAIKKFLAAEGLELEFQYKDDWGSPGFIDACDRADLIINQKCLLKKTHADTLFRLGKPICFDFDDALWTRPGKPYSLLTGLKVKSRLRYILERSTAVIVANNYLAEYAKSYAGNVMIIPMGLDLEDWRPASSFSDKIVMGWNGAPNNLPQLYAIADQLRKVLDTCNHVELAVCCGAEPELDMPYRYVPFEPRADRTFVQGINIGLLPMEDHEYSRGKSSIKALQYMASASAVVGNWVGATAELLGEDRAVQIVNSGDWESALTSLLNDRERMIALGAGGRAFMEAKHDVKSIALQLLAFLRKQ